MQSPGRADRWVGRITAAAIAAVFAPAATAANLAPHPVRVHPLLRLKQSIAPGEVIVRFKPRATRSAKSAAFAAVEPPRTASCCCPIPRSCGSRRARRLRPPPRLAQQPGRALRRAQRHRPCGRRSQRRPFPGSSGRLNNTGQPVAGVAGTPDADIDAPEAWNLGRGLASPVRVAVIDTGVAMDHPDLAASIFTNPGESGREGDERRRRRRQRQDR